MIPKDEKSEGRLMQLHPAIRHVALEAYRQAVLVTPVGVHPFITETMRSFKRSNELYAQGRTKPGKIVTNAPAGASYHNYGLAIDFVNLVNGKMHWVVDDNWMKVVKAFKVHGFAWGGDFNRIKDAPHFEMTFGLSWRQLLYRYNEKDFIEGTNYVRL